MSVVPQPMRRLILCVDMERYSSRNDVDQSLLQEAFPEIMAEAAAWCGLGREGWTIQSTGDGELAIFPEEISEPLVVAELVPALDRALRHRNQRAAEHMRIRLRAGLHQGLILPTANGMAGRAVVKVCRLVEANPLYQALAAFPDATVALIVSAEVYSDIVAQSYPGIRSERFKKVTVQVKSFAEEAWICVPEENVNHAMPGNVPAVPAPAPAEQLAPPSYEPDPGRSGGSRTTIHNANSHGGPFVVGDYTTVNGTAGAGSSQ